LGTVEEVSSAIEEALDGWEPEQERDVVVREMVADSLLAFFDNPDNPLEIAAVTSFRARDALAMSRTPYSHDNQAAEEQEQVLLLRDISGNPFRHSAIDLVLLSWRDGTIPKLAQAIYEERAFDRMPILGDALEDAGITDGDLLRHVREPGVHVRGCWVLDLLLQKE
jgi:hypothetical protein